MIVFSYFNYFLCKISNKTKIENIYTRYNNLFSEDCNKTSKTKMLFILKCYMIFEPIITTSGIILDYHDHDKIFFN